jgi:hypothetical protein
MESVLLADWNAMNYGKSTETEQAKGDRGGDVYEPDASVAGVGTVDDTVANMGARALAGRLYNDGYWSDH